MFVLIVIVKKVTTLQYFVFQKLASIFDLKQLNIYKKRLLFKTILKVFEKYIHYNKKVKKTTVNIKIFIHTTHHV